MVIDGLRYDFVTEEYMPYTGQLLKNKSACIYVSVAEPPTVTMPRIKVSLTRKKYLKFKKRIVFFPFTIPKKKIVIYGKSLILELLYCCVQSPERKKEKAQWRRTINFWRDIFASVTFT